MGRQNNISFAGYGGRSQFSPSFQQYQQMMASAPAQATEPRQITTGQDVSNDVMSGPIQNAVRASLGYDRPIGDMEWGWSPQYSGLRQQNDYARGMALARQRDANAGFNGFNQRIYQLLHENDAIPSYTPMVQPTAAPKTAPAQKQTASTQGAPTQATPTQAAPTASAPQSVSSPVTASVSPRLAQGAPKIGYSQPSSTTKSTSKGNSSTGNHEVTSDYEGNFQPGDGYDWTPPYQPGDGYDWTPPSSGGNASYEPPMGTMDGGVWTPAGVDGSYVDTPTSYQPGTNNAPIAKEVLTTPQPYGMTGDNPYYQTPSGGTRPKVESYTDENGVIHITTPIEVTGNDVGPVGYQLGDSQFYLDGLDPDNPIFRGNGGMFSQLEPYV